MNRNRLNFLVDGITALAALNLVFTGLLIYFVLPPGSGRTMTVLNGDRHGWGDVHFWTAMVVLALVLVHVALHWPWVCMMVGRMCGGGAALPRVKRNIAGAAAVLLIASLIGGLLWGAAAIRQTDPAPRRGQDAEPQRLHEGRGRQERRGWWRDQPTGMLWRSCDTASEMIESA